MTYPHPYRHIDKIPADEHINVSARFCTIIGQITNVHPINLFRLTDELIEVELRPINLGPMARMIVSTNGEIIGSCYKEHSYQGSNNDVYTVVTVLWPKFFEPWNRAIIEVKHKGVDSFWTLGGGPLPVLRQQAIELYGSTKEKQHA